MNPIQRAVWAVVIVTGTTAFGPAAQAALDDGNKESVRLLADDAALAYEQGRYSEAQEKFQHAYDTARVPTLALWLAKTNAKLGHVVAAIELCRQAASLEKNDLWIGDIQQRAQQEADELRAQLQSRVARIVVMVEGAAPKDVSLRIDQIVLPSTLVGVDRLVDPGTRLVVGRLGQQEVKAQITLAEGEKQEVRLKFEATAVASPQPAAVPSPPRPEPSPANRTPSPKVESRNSSLHTLGWVGLGIGAAGVAFGTVTGILVASKHSTLSDKCPQDRCERAYWSELDGYERLRTLSAVGFVVGGVAAVAGVTLLLTSPKQESPVHATLYVGPQTLAIQGAF